MEIVFINKKNKYILIYLMVFLSTVIMIILRSYNNKLTYKTYKNMEMEDLNFD